MGFSQLGLTRKNISQDLAPSLFHYTTRRCLAPARAPEKALPSQAHPQNTFSRSNLPPSTWPGGVGRGEAEPTKSF